MGIDFLSPVRFVWRTLSRLWAVVPIILCSCAIAPPPPGLPCRFADDRQVYATAVYLSPGVAIIRHLKVENNETQASFALGRAHWEKPELAGDTGDRFDEQVKGNISRIGPSTGGVWLLAESEDYDFDRHKPVKFVTAIHLATGTMHSATNMMALRKQLNDDPALATVRLEPVDFFFEQQLIARLRQGK